MDDDFGGWRQDGCPSWYYSSNVQWRRYIEDEGTSDAHSHEQVTPGLSEQVAALTGIFAQLQQDVAGILSAKFLQQAPATSIQLDRCGTDSFFDSRTRGHVLALDDLPSADGGRQVSQSPRGTAKAVSFCRAKGTPPGT